MNANPIIIQPSQNPNSGNTPFYSFNITLYPCQDASLISPSGRNDSSLSSSEHQSSKNSFNDNNYFPKGWTPIPQPPPLSQSGKTISIPVPVPNSIYQCFQNFPSENTNAYNYDYNTTPNQFSNCPREYNNKDFTPLHRSNVVPVSTFAAINNSNNSPSYVIPRGDYYKSKSISTNRNDRKITPLPPPPPPQYFATGRSSREEFEKKEATERNFRQLHKTLLEDLKEENFRRYNNLLKSNSCPQNYLVTPTVDCYSVLNQVEDRHRLEELFSTKDEKFKGGGDSSDSYSPENSEDKFSCECIVCKDMFEEEEKKNNSLQSLSSRAEDTIHKSIAHIPSSILWGQMNNFANNNAVKVTKKLIDKATCPMKTTLVNYDNSPVWEFQRREANKFNKFCPAKTHDTCIQCDIDDDFPLRHTSAEVLWARGLNKTLASHSEHMISIHSNYNEDREDYVPYTEEYTPESAPRQRTTIISKTKASVNQMDQDRRNNNITDYEDDDNISRRENSAKFSENSNRTEYSQLDKPVESPKSTTSSVVYQIRRPTFEEVMEYLEKADEQEKQEKSLPHHKSSVSSKKTNKTYSLVRRDADASNSNIYSVKYEAQYKKDFQKVNPPKPKGSRRVSNYSKYQDSYTEVVCRRPPEEMFPASPGVLDFPKNALGRVLTFLDSNYWQQVLDGFRLAVRLARHHPEVLSEDLRPVVWKSEKHLASLKSAVSRAALACFAELILNLGKAMEPFVDKILAKILLKSMDCNKFLRWECRNVLNAIVYAFPIGKSLSCLEIGFKHKSAMVRSTISTMLKKWVIKVGAPKVMAGFADRILPMIISLLQERGWEARAGAKETMNLLITHPNFMSHLRSCVPYEELIESSRRVKCIRDLMEQDCLNFRI